MLSNGSRSFCLVNDVIGIKEEGRVLSDLLNTLRHVMLLPLRRCMYVCTVFLHPVLFNFMAC